MAKASTVIIIVLLVIIVLGGAAAFLYVGGFIKLGNTPAAVPTHSSGGSGLFIDPSAGEYVAPTKAPLDTKPSVALPGWGTITIPANTIDIGVGIDFRNPEKNEGYYYLTFELRLADGESLYKSGLVEPGKHIQKIKLSRGLSAGTYEAFVIMQPYNMDAGITPTANNGQVKITLVAK